MNLEGEILVAVDHELVVGVDKYQRQACIYALAYQGFGLAAARYELTRRRHSLQPEEIIN